MSVITGDKSILIIDDNKDLLNVLDLILSGHFWEVETLTSPNQLVHLLGKRHYDVILLDMNFSSSSPSGNEGFFWLSEIKKIDPDQTVVMITAYGDIDMAVRSLKDGAVDFIDKAWDQSKILSTLEAAWQISISKRQISKLKSQRSHLAQQINENTPVFWGESKAIIEVKRLVEKVAKTSAHVLILGESGSGKEVVARAIHKNSMRAEEVFISVDMGSIPGSLFESEMFGYEKGAFTGANKSKVGRMFLAGGGTLFLDEIGNLTQDLQSKLLRVLDTRQLIPLGSQKTLSVDFRLITATNSPLAEMVKDGSFREDLFYRINTITITVPPLRDRPLDIKGLADLFLRHYNRKHSKNHQFRRSDISKMEKYSWPGNVRQLKHTIERSVILSDGPFLNLEYLGSNDLPDTPIDSENRLNLAQNEQKLLRAALVQASGNISKAANLLGINRSTLYDKIKKYGL